jgi:hypothetical protein
MAAEPLVRPLFEGPVDVVGDVHGEVDALQKLLHRLGYDGAGRHPQGRRLVLVGDLTDRGPDSPAVVDVVRRLVEAGRAQCVLGNHEFNILARRAKPENGWLLDGAPDFQHDGTPVPQRRAEGEARRRIVDFFATLPVALERPDARVVHACWDDDKIERLRRETDVLHAYEHYRQAIDARLPEGADEVEVALARQNDSPVKLLTSGPERRSAVPFLLNGKLRYEARVPWWSDYRAGPLVVFGHYWRTSLPGEEATERLFDGRARNEALGPAALCIDYSVGKRYRERLRPGFDGTFVTRLAALRLPERVLVYDEEEGEEPLVVPGP